RAEDYPNFFTKENNALLRNFILVMKNIKDFIEEIDNFGSFKKFFQANIIKQTFEEITSDFDSYMSSLQFSLIVDLKLQTTKDKDHEALKKDAKESEEYFKFLFESIRFTNDRVISVSNVDETTRKAYALSRNIEYVVTLKSNLDKQIQNYEIKTDAPLNINNFKCTDEVRSKKVRKWYNDIYGKE
ncbi:33937_t:CDS:2, partial [Racocetra persica]